jgi:hypothetical protein
LQSSKGEGWCLEWELIEFPHDEKNNLTLFHSPLSCAGIFQRYWVGQLGSESAPRTGKHEEG